jgi:hypothetical protein
MPGSHLSLPLAARWDGRRWSVQSIPYPPQSRETWLQGVSCPSANVCTAVGFAGVGGGNAKLPLAERWNGHSWSLQKVAGPSSAREPDLLSVSCPSANVCIAVGVYVKNRTGLTLAEHWDGRRWSVEPTRNPSGQSGPLTGSGFYRVSCASALTCTAVGAYGGFQSTVTLAERWNGSNWTIQKTPHPTPNHASFLSAVSCPTTKLCTAVGSYDNWHGPGIPLAEGYS